jgi:hypothetical protein
MERAEMEEGRMERKKCKEVGEGKEERGGERRRRTTKIQWTGQVKDSVE